MTLAPAFLLPVLLAFAKTTAKVAKVLANRRAARQLSEWDSAALKDIGLTRNDLSGALSLPLYRDPTEYLASVAIGRSRPARQDGATAAGTSRPVPASKLRSGELPSATPALCT